MPYPGPKSFAGRRKRHIHDPRERRGDSSAAQVLEVAVGAVRVEVRLGEGDGGMEDFLQQLAQTRTELLVVLTEVGHLLLFLVRFAYADDGGIVCRGCLVDVEQCRGDGQRLAVRHDGGVEEGLQDVVRTALGGGEEHLDAGCHGRLATGLVVHNAQRAVLAVEAVDDAADADRMRARRGAEREILVDGQLHGDHAEGSVVEVLLEQLAEVADDDFGVEQLDAVVLGLVLGTDVEEEFLEGAVDEVLQAHLVA